MGTYGGHYLQCDLLAGFEHGFFTRQWQGREPEELAGEISAGVSVHRTRQVHGGTLLAAGEAEGAPGRRPMDCAAMAAARASGCAAPTAPRC